MSCWAGWSWAVSSPHMTCRMCVRCSWPCAFTARVQLLSIAAAQRAVAALNSRHQPIGVTVHAVSCNRHGPTCCFEDDWFCAVRRHFAHFAAVVAEAPGQCLRYCFDEGAEPLWPSRHHTPVPQDIPACQYCGSARRFEFQVTLCCLGCLDYLAKCMYVHSSQLCINNHIQHASDHVKAVT